MRNIDTIIIHHSASPRSTTVETIRGWHLARGWRDIGYHFVIDGAGKVWPGRDIGDVGAHARGNNQGSIGICVTGDNRKTARRWTWKQVAALGRLITALQLVLPGLAVIYGHGSVAVTDCPGVDFKGG